MSKDIGDFPPQQQLFIRAYAKLHDPEQAAQAAGYKKRGQGNALLKKPDIIQAIMGYQERVRESTKDEINFTMVDILNEVHNIAMDRFNVSPKDRLAGARMLLEYFGGLKPGSTINNLNVNSTQNNQNNFKIMIAPAVDGESALEGDFLEIEPEIKKYE